MEGAFLEITGQVAPKVSTSRKASLDRGTGQAGGDRGHAD